MNFISHLWLVATALDSTVLGVLVFGQKESTDREKGSLEKNEGRIEIRRKECIKHFWSLLSLPTGVTGVSQDRDQRAGGAECSSK